MIHRRTGWYNYRWLPGSRTQSRRERCRTLSPEDYSNPLWQLYSIVHSSYWYLVRRRLGLELQSLVLKAPELSRAVAHMALLASQRKPGHRLWSRYYSTRRWCSTWIISVFDVEFPVSLTGFHALNWATVMLLARDTVSQVSLVLTVYTLQVLIRHKLPVVGKSAQLAAKLLSCKSQDVLMCWESETEWQSSPDLMLYVWPVHDGTAGTELVGLD